MKILDRYIIRKFLGTFFFSLALIILIAVIFDISEKIDDFIERKAPFSKIVFDYYFNFIPYFANLFAPLFVFISVIYFTARMAANTEIVAILNSGISFRRMLRPYFMAAGFLAALSFYFNGWVIPHSNKVKLEFENVYIKNPVEFKDRNIHETLEMDVQEAVDHFHTSEIAGMPDLVASLEVGKYPLVEKRMRVGQQTYIHSQVINNQLFNYSTIKLQPRISATSSRPSTSKLPSAYTLPRSSVAMKLQVSRLARSTMFRTPVRPSGASANGSLASLATTRIVPAGTKRPPVLYACENSSVMPYSE